MTTVFGVKACGCLVPTQTPQGCNGPTPCLGRCQLPLQCTASGCRHPSCPSDTDCVCPGLPTLTPTPTTPIVYSGSCADIFIYKYIEGSDGQIINDFSRELRPGDKFFVRAAFAGSGIEKVGLRVIRNGAEVINDARDTGGGDRGSMYSAVYQIPADGGSFEIYGYVKITGVGWR